MKTVKTECVSAGLVVAFLSLMSTNGISAVVSCEFDDNDEWPQPAGKTCQIDSPELPVGVLLLSDDSAAGSARWPTCTAAAIDPDGDGWGWENYATCLVPDTNGGHPDCDSNSTDSDGDGWGWENGASCKVTLTPKTGSYPECDYRSSDPDGDGWGYENGQSCQVGSGTRHPICSGAITDADGDGWGYENGSSCQFVTPKISNGVVFEQDFESADVGSYGADQVNDDWDTPIWHLGFSQGRVDVVNDSERGKSLRVTYPANQFGSAGATAFLSDLQFGVDLSASYEELYVAYDVKFAAGFDFVRGGKLPGLCGYDNTQSTSSGCNTGGGFPDGFDGWSARGMWREDGVLENYVYHAGQTNYYGDDEYWGAQAQPGQWHRVQHRVVLNTPGVANGILEAWLDGNKVLSDDTYLFRNTANIGINLFYFSTFYGGNDSSWAPSQDQYVFFDNFRISTDSDIPVIGEAVAFDGLSLNDDAGGDGESVASTGGGTFNPALMLLLVLLTATVRVLRQVAGARASV